MSASGSLALAQSHLVTSLASAAAFRAWCGAADEAAARLRIHEVGLPKPANGRRYTPEEMALYRPFALVGIVSRGGYTLSRQSAWGSSDRGRFYCYFEAAIPEGLIDDPAEAERQFVSALGAIVDDLMGQADTPGRLNITEIDLAQAPMREQLDEQPADNPHYWAAIEVAWSGGALMGGG